MTRRCKAKFTKCNSLAEANELIHVEIEKRYNALLDMETIPTEFKDIDELFGNSEQLNLSFYEFIQKEVKEHYMCYISYLNSINDLSMSMNAIRAENLLAKVLKSLKWAYESYYKKFDPELCVNQAIKACQYATELYKDEKKTLNKIISNRR